ncbi:MAG: DUF4124 domain-containing protein [Caldimonas sp.]
MVRPFVALLAALAAALAAPPAEAQWKWKDKSGHVQYSDLPPPPSTPEQDILGKPSAQKGRGVPAQAPAGLVAGAAPASAASAALAPRSVDPELEAKRKKAEAELAAKTKADEEKFAIARAENCVRARSQVKTLDSGVRLARANDKGEREILDDKQRADEMKRARDAVAGNCK